MSKSLSEITCCMTKAFISIVSDQWIYIFYPLLLCQYFGHMKTTVLT